MLYVFDDFPNITTEQFNATLQSLPQWRYCRAMKYHNLIDRQLCAMGYVLLRDGLKSEYQIDDNFFVAFHPTGKPYLK